jgi:heat shock protein HslJ
MKKYIGVFIVILIVTGLLFQPGCKKSEEPIENPLTGINWVLQTIQYSAANVIVIEDPFSILFYNDGTHEMVVDCNTCVGTYEIGANAAITFTSHSECTEAFCGQDSRDAEFHVALDSASRYEIDGSSLRIYFNNGASLLNFNAQ